MKTFGYKSYFAISIGEYCPGSKDLRLIDVWAENNRLCINDNVAYIDQFIDSLEYDIKRDYKIKKYNEYFSTKTPIEIAEDLLEKKNDIESVNFILYDDIFWRYRFLDLGATTDNILAFLFDFGDKSYFVYTYKNDSEKLNFSSIEVNFKDFIDICKNVINYLREERK